MIAMTRRRRCIGLALTVAASSLVSGAIVSPAAGASAAPTSQPVAANIQPRAGSTFDDTYAIIGQIYVQNDDSSTKPNPATLAVDYGDDTVYVANAWLGTVEAIASRQINGSTAPRVQVGTLVPRDSSFPNTTASGKGLFGIAVDTDDDTVYVVNRGQSPSYLWAVNGRSMTVDDTVALTSYCSGTNPNAYGPEFKMIAVNSLTNTIYVPCRAAANDGSASVLAIDGHTLAVIHSYTLANYVFSGIALDDTGNVFLSGWGGGSGSVRKLNSSLTLQSTWVPPFGKPSAVVSLDDSIYVASFDDSILWVRSLSTSAQVSVSLGGRVGWQGLAYQNGPDPMIFVGSDLCCSAQGLVSIYVPDLSVRNINGTGTASIVVTSQDLLYTGNHFDSQLTYGRVFAFGKVPDLAAAPVGTPGNGQVSLVWSAPNSGTTILDYKVTASPGGASCTVAVTSCTISGLSNGTAYTFVLQARNATGWSSASAPSAPVTPQAPPPPPPPRPVANMQLTVASSPARFEKAGDVLSITATILNSGTDSLNSVQVNQGTIPLSCMPSTPVTWLAPGNSVVCRGTHVVTEEDVDAAVVRDRIAATAVAGSTGSQLSAIAVLEVPGPPPPERLQLRVVMNSTPSSFTRRGERLNLTALVSNTGNVPVRDLIITGSPVDFVCTPSSPVRSLPVKGTMRCSGSYEVTKADMAVGTIRGLIRATGSSSSGARIASTGAVEVNRTSPERPALKVTMTSSPESFRRVGQVLTFTAIVTNRGDVALRNVTVTGRPVGFNCTPPSPVAVLDIDAKVTCTARYVVTQADMTAGVIRVTARASGSTAKGNTTSDDVSVRVRRST